MDLRKATNRNERASLLSEETQLNISEVQKVLIDDEARIHCENLIGAVTIPLGVAGPLAIQKDSKTSIHYVPLATTEGALVASVSRGCKATHMSHGVVTRVVETGTSRGPVFYVESLTQQAQFISWLHNNEKDIKKMAESTSHHLTYLSMHIQTSGLHIYVRFMFNTDQAMGMNMVTIATQKLVEYISEKTGVTCLAVAGNYDVDKKPSWMNMINGRGIQAWAECVISEEALTKVLKTTSEKLYNVWLAKCMVGSAMSGSLGYNAHYANIVAAFFAATGQDLAHVVEGSMGITYMEKRANGIYLSVYLPSLMLGMVGGGTGLITQTEARSLTKVQTKNELAEVLVAAVLCGELSLLSSLSAGTLASAHKNLGR